jgi:hypothetical protein
VERQRPAGVADDAGRGAAETSSDTKKKMNRRFTQIYADMEDGTPVLSVFICVHLRLIFF